jgi:predicted AAA+ superfamily ATPase
MIERIYQHVIQAHFSRNRQMLFLSGPRQVGKTTSSLSLVSQERYLNWDNEVHRALILAGPEVVARHFGILDLQDPLPLVVFDEIHKYRHWKRFLKGFFDTYEKRLRIIVTGSARLDVYKRGGDSMMGRYFLYRLHPLSLRELADPSLPTSLISSPVSCAHFDALFEYGGFPEPFVQKNAQFSHQWQRLRMELLFKEDLRDLTRIQDIGQIEHLAHLLTRQVGQLIDYTSLATQVKVSSPTIQRWIKALSNLYFCFTIQPWSRNIAKALRKQPKVFLWDWTMTHSLSARTENFIASHLLKAVQFWTDAGFGDFALYYLRDTAKREVDFLVTKDDQPWFLVEAKTSAHGISPALHYFQKETKAPFAFQVFLDKPFVNADCFLEGAPIHVPARTFLSQLV